MPVSRRSFLKGLLAAGVMTAAPNLMGQDDKKDEKKNVPYFFGETDSQDVQLLMNRFFPLLKINEGEKIQFYLCSSDKVSVGYGTNMEANQSWFQDVLLSYDGKKLSQKESQKSYDKMKALSKALAEKCEKLKKGTIGKKEVEKERKMVKAELARYAIQPLDALRLAEKGMRSFIGMLEKQIVNPKTKKSVLFELPFCMQALALDVMYQIGPAKFTNYKKFKAALLARDFDTATKESKVYLNKEKKTVSLNRERRKKRLLRVMKIVQTNKNNPACIPNLIKEDYCQNVPETSWRKKFGIPYIYMERAINQPIEVPCEIILARGELDHVRLCRQRAIKAMKSQQKARLTNSAKNTRTLAQKTSQSQGR